MAKARVASSATSVVLLAAGNERQNVIIENSDANRLHIVIADGGAAAVDNYSFSLAQNENARLYDYAGEIQGIWAADGAGYAMVTTY